MRTIPYLFETEQVRKMAEVDVIVVQVLLLQKDILELKFCLLLIFKLVIQYDYRLCLQTRER